MSELLYEIFLKVMLELVIEHAGKNPRTVRQLLGALRNALVILLM